MVEGHTKDEASSAAAHPGDPLNAPPDSPERRSPARDGEGGRSRPPADSERAGDSGGARYSPRPGDQGGQRGQGGQGGQVPAVRDGLIGVYQAAVAALTAAPES